MLKILYYDLETTGLDFRKNAVVQLSGMLEIDGTVVQKFNFKMAPFKDAVIDKQALLVIGKTEEELFKAQTMQEVYFKFKNMLSKYVDRFNKYDKIFLCGYNNIRFDDIFQRSMFERCKDNYFGSWFWGNSMDAMVSASEHLALKRNRMVNFKLSTVAKELGVEVDNSKLHDALYDVELTRAVHKLTFKPNEF